MTQQPAPTADQLKLNPAAVPTQSNNSFCITKSTIDHFARTNTSRPQRHTPGQPRIEKTGTSITRPLQPAFTATSLRTTTLLGLVPTLQCQITPRLTKDCINREIVHLPSASNTSKSPTVSNIYHLTILLHLQSAPNTETILDSWV